MPTFSPQNTKGLCPEALGRLQRLIEKVTCGEFLPFKEKTERARQNLKKAGLI
jgi:hypothetical protein